MAVKEIVAKVSEQMGNLPALSTVVSQVLRMTEDPNTSTGDVCEVVQSDPGLTAKVLRVSNSSYYGMRQYVGTLKLALVILGVREVRNIVLGISVFDTLKGEQDDVRLAQEIWNASLRRAGFARHLAKHIGLGLQGEEFIAGLLSDIGKMGLLRRSPEEYRGILEDNDSLTDLLEAEQTAFGFDHADVALALAENWSLPQTLSQALWHQYPRPGHMIDEARDPNLAAIARITRLAVEDDFSKPGGQASLMDEEAWAVLDQARKAIPAEERCATLAAFMKELDEAPALPCSAISEPPYRVEIPMSKKENVRIIRADDFETIDEELAQAMSLLDDTNTRVLDVLTSETLEGETAELPFDGEEDQSGADAPPSEGNAPVDEDAEAGG